MEGLVTYILATAAVCIYVIVETHPEREQRKKKQAAERAQRLVQDAADAHARAEAATRKYLRYYTRVRSVRVQREKEAISD